MYDKDLTIEPFTDAITFSMDPNLIDWDSIDEMSNSDPSSKEYRRAMRKARITGRNLYPIRRWRDDDDE